MLLQQDFECLTSPDATDSNIFSAKLLPKYIGVRIAKDNQMRPAILISGSSDYRPGNFRLKYLELSVRRNCEVIADGSKIKEDFILILFRSIDPTLTPYFFSIIETFLSALEKAITTDEKRQAYDSLLEIFRALNDNPLNTIQGLWSELFVISQSDKISTMIEAWHDSPSARFDFVYLNKCLEVKSSKILQRIHNFAALQLIPDSDITIFIASLFVIESSSGQSLKDLINRVNNELSEPAQRQKLERITARTLGRGISTSIEVRFDASIAKNSLSFYDAIQIPKIELNHIPRYISDVHFIADLSNQIPLTTGLQCFM